MVQINNKDRGEILSYLTELQGQSQHDQNLVDLTVIFTGENKQYRLDEYGNINLDVYDTHQLYHLVANLEHKEILDLFKVKVGLDLLFTDVPEFFCKAFYSRELCLYSGDKDISSFFKSNVLLPIYHKDSGSIQTSNELEHILKHHDCSIESNINKEIERINRLIADPPQQNYTEQEQQKLPFFELFKSMISPELAKDEKCGSYTYINKLVQSELELKSKTQTRFRAAQLKENKDLGDNDHSLGIDWNNKSDSNKTNNKFFSNEHPARLSEKEDYQKLDITIENENGNKEFLHDFMDRYLAQIHFRHQIVIADKVNTIPEFWNHVFLAEDRKSSNSYNTEHARLKLECKAPEYTENVCDENFFIRMAFESTDELGVYKMTKEGRQEYHHNMVFHEKFNDDTYIYAADDIIKVTDISEDTYQQAGACAGIIKQADQKSYLTMAMHLVPHFNSATDCLSDYKRRHGLIPRGTAAAGDDEDLVCDSQNSHSRIDPLSNPEAQGLPKGGLKASFFKIRSINFDRVSALVMNKELYKSSTKDAQQLVESCVNAMQEKMDRMIRKENNLSRTTSLTRPSAPPLLLYQTPIVGATAGPSSNLNFDNMDQCLEEDNTPPPRTPLFYISGPGSPISLIYDEHFNFPSTRLLTESYDVRSFKSNESIPSSLDSIEVLQVDCSSENLQFHKGV